MEKHIVRVLLLAVLLFISCETMEQTGALSERQVNGSSATVSADSTANDNSVSAKNGYAIPKSYDMANSYRTGKPFDLVNRIPEEIDALRNKKPLEYLQAVCGMINERAQNDFEKAKMAHDVIATLVSYDAKSYNYNQTISFDSNTGINYTDQSWQSVLKRKVAVCSGYVSLYKRFCDELGIRCEKVFGYARGAGYNSIYAENLYGAGHAWNIVQIEGEWYFVDVTWDSHPYRTEYLFSEPSIFLYTHFPKKAEFQLMEKPISEKEFLKYKRCTVVSPKQKTLI